MTAEAILDRFGEEYLEALGEDDTEWETRKLRLARTMFHVVSRWVQARDAEAEKLGRMRLQICEFGHRWYAPMFDELGGGFYFDDAHAYCPHGDHPDIYNDRTYDGRFGGRE